MNTGFPICATCHGIGFHRIHGTGGNDTCQDCEGSGSSDPAEHIAARNQRLFDPMKPRRHPLVDECVTALSVASRLDDCTLDGLCDAIRAAVLDGYYWHQDDEDDSGSPIITSTLEGWRLAGATLFRADAVALLGRQEVEDIEAAAYERSRDENADARHDERITEVA